jgi:tetratricopeptide (TPR) repeat protein
MAPELVSNILDTGRSGDEEVPQIIDGLPLIEAATKLKEEGNAHVKRKCFNDAVSAYERAVAILDKADGHPVLRKEVEQMISLKATLFGNMAQCLLNLELFRRAVEAATASLALDEQNPKVLHRRSQAYEALRNYGEALDDALALHRLGGGGLLPEVLKTRMESLRDKKVEVQKAKDDESSEDECDTELVTLKQRFDEVVEKYELRNDDAASEVAEWLTSGEWLVTIRRVAQRWKMEEQDAVDFLKWISKGLEFKMESSSMPTRAASGPGTPDLLAS